MHSYGDLFGDLIVLPEQHKPKRPVRPLTMSEFRDYGDGLDRVPDWRIAELLVFNRQRSIHNIINRHHTEFEDFAPLLQLVAKSTGGRPGFENFLTFEQAMYAVAQSQALNAVPMLKHMIKIYGMWARDELMPRDAAAELKASDATAKAVEGAPGLMRLVNPAAVDAAGAALRSMNIITGNELRNAEAPPRPPRTPDPIPLTEVLASLKRIEASQYELLLTNNNIHKHLLDHTGGDFSEETKRLARRTDFYKFDRRCPISGEIILDENCDIIKDERGHPIAEYDHWGQRSDGNSDNCLLVHRSVHLQLTTKKLSRSKALPFFQVFQIRMRQQATEDERQPSLFEKPAP